MLLLLVLLVLLLVVLVLVLVVLVVLLLVMLLLLVLLVVLLVVLLLVVLVLMLVLLLLQQLLPGSLNRRLRSRRRVTSPATPATITSIHGQGWWHRNRQRIRHLRRPAPGAPAFPASWSGEAGARPRVPGRRDHRRHRGPDPRPTTPASVLTRLAAVGDGVATAAAPAAVPITAAAVVAIVAALDQIRVASVGIVTLAQYTGRGSGRPSRRQRLVLLRLVLLRRQSGGGVVVILRSEVLDVPHHRMAPAPLGRHPPQSLAVNQLRRIQIQVRFEIRIPIRRIEIQIQIHAGLGQVQRQAAVLRAGALTLDPTRLLRPPGSGSGRGSGNSRAHRRRRGRAVGGAGWRDRVGARRAAAAGRACVLLAGRAGAAASGGGGSEGVQLRRHELNCSPGAATAAATAAAMEPWRRPRRRRRRQRERLLGARDQRRQPGSGGGSGWRRRELRRQQPLIGILFVEGFETTGHTISWTLFNIATTPGVQEAVAAELRSVGLLVRAAPEGGPSAARPLELDDLKRLPYLTACVKARGDADVPRGLHHGPAFWPAGVAPKSRMTGTASTVVPSSDEKQ
ncbi:hypothetical protein TSOC_005598 [Tetrabaena socialis]|uniref:Uncharacterized protein n=1 Tax=Tetrabaena socialis TaxID=47790 RepID=A0A2J8A5W7_9CHLO|nr:hypothetical protein TSOC_005598 [Tetrabaena socialis]|eukprot:PNH07895.1 hypothetical protein TSOC_005598 [Tetrabaena socialis]